MTLQSFVQEMPKAELHVHLEESIRPATLLKLARRNGVDLPIKNPSGLRTAEPSLDDLRQLYRFSTLIISSGSISPSAAVSRRSTIAGLSPTDSAPTWPARTHATPR